MASVEGFSCEKVRTPWRDLHRGRRPAPCSCLARLRQCVEERSQAIGTVTELDSQLEDLTLRVQFQLASNGYPHPCPPRTARSRRAFLEQ